MLCTIWAGSKMWRRVRASVIVAKVTLRRLVGTPEGDFLHSGAGWCWESEKIDWQEPCKFDCQLVRTIFYFFAVPC